MTNDDVAQATHILRADREHGAMQLAIRAVELAADLIAAKPERDWHEVVLPLAVARPSMVAIANALALFAPSIPTGDRNIDSSTVHDQAARIISRWRSDAQELLLNAARHVPAVVLAYSNSSTTRALLLAHPERIERVVVPEGRPINDGKRLATVLAAAGIPVTVITEAQMGAWVPEVGAILVGADTIMPDGALVNHMGTATFALLAEIHHVPVISASHSLKIAPYFRSEDVQEENDPAELWHDAPSGVTLRNLTFDITPPERVTIITERGVLTDSLRDAIVETHRDAWVACGFISGDASTPH